MDAKITLSFKKAVADKAKEYAEENNVSLSRLVEYLLDKVTADKYSSFEDFPVAAWVSQVAEGAASYQTKARSREAMKKEFYEAKKMKVFADANILVSVLNKEYPVFTYASRILSLAGSSHTQIVTSPICLAIAWYFAEKSLAQKQHGIR